MSSILHRGRRWFPTGSLLVSLGLSVSLGGFESAFALPVAWDLRFGPSHVGVTDELADSLEHPGLGLDGGVSVRWPASGSLFSVQGDFLLVSRSRSFDDLVTSGLGAGTTLRRSLRVIYAQTPLLARASLSQEGMVRPYLLAGPYVAWRLSSGFEPGDYFGNEPVNPSDVRAMDYGAIIGIGTRIVTKNGAIALEARLGMGGVDILEDRTGVQGAYRVWTFFLAFSP